MARRRRLVVTAGLLVTAGAVAAGMWITGTRTDSPETADASAAGTSGGADAAAAATTSDAAFPPGSVPEDELPDAGDIATDEPAPAPAADDVPVLVTYAGWDPASSAVEVSGIVDRVVESGGTCTATLTSGDRTVTASGPATPDVATTACGSVFVAGAELAPGTWSAVLAFTSSTSSGESDQVQVQVP